MFQEPGIRVLDSCVTISAYIVFSVLNISKDMTLSFQIRLVPGVISVTVWDITAGVTA